MRYILATLLVLLNLIACSEQRAPLQGEVSDHDFKKTEGIVGGDDVKASDRHVDFVVMIAGKYEDGKPFTCSGTLIDYDLVLTAGHCIGAKDSMKVIFGANPIEHGPVLVSTVKEAFRHDLFNEKEDVRNDIGIIQMSEIAPKNLAPARLPWTVKRTLDTQKFQVYGFGITSGVLNDEKKPDLSTVGTLRSTSLTTDRTSESGDAFYAKQDQGKGICSADSGGPAFVHSNILIGVIARGIIDDPTNPQAADNDICNYESVFTNVTYYKTWILETTEKLHRIGDVPDELPSLNYLSE